MSEKCDDAAFEDGRRGHKARNMVTSRNWSRQGNKFFPSTSRKKCNLAKGLIVAQAPGF